MKVSFHQSGQRFLELMVGQRITKRVYWAVRVAQEVRKQKEPFIGARGLGTESLDQGQYMVRGPAGDECTKYERYSTKSLASPVL